MKQINVELHFRIRAVKESKRMSEKKGIWVGPEFRTGLAHLIMARQARQP